MNAERLHLIITAINEDLDKTSLIKRMDELIAALNGLINQPQEAQQKAVSGARDGLLKAIRGSYFGQFPRTWRSVLEEIRIEDSLGPALELRISEIFNRSQLTPVDARDDIQKIRNELGEYQTSFTSIISGFDFLKIEEPELEEGEAELSIFIPRTEFSNEVGKFAEEVKQISKWMGLFSEISTGSRENPTVKQLSTSDPIIIISLTAPVLLLALGVVGKIQEIIKNTFDIRKIRNEAEKAGLELKILKSLDESVTNKINTGLNEIENWLISKSSHDKMRRGELQTEANRVLKQMAYRLDNGYQIEGDVGEIEQIDTDQIKNGIESEDLKIRRKKQEQLEDIIKKIKELSHRTKHQHLPEETVLRLPSLNEDGNDDAGD